ncbi:zinc finger HIT domain-containing protein, partial [Campylobacter coli]|nr:zinc finger HIT domain-containing protein [Campylobacter coli]
WRTDFPHGQQAQYPYTMGDTLLTDLCSICHVSAPKYKFPRCDLRTCSLPCIKRHKARSDCSGVRDATAYVPRKKLATAAGVDHDY